MPADLIRQAARMYAAGRAIIPWNPATDQMSNSTQALRAMGILRAICGNIDVPGGELMMGFHPTVITEDEWAMTHLLSKEQMDKQLVLESAKLLTYEFWNEFNEAQEKVFGRKWVSQIHSGALANPAAVMRAMSHGDPYPVKGFLNVGSDPVSSYTDARHMHDGFMSLDLLVSVDIFMVPTAQMSDFIMPAAVWGEKYDMHNHWDWHTFMIAGDKAVEPLGEAKEEYHFFRELGRRTGQAEYWPWDDHKELINWRLKDHGMTIDELMAQPGGGIAHFAEHPVIGSDQKFKKYEQTGFATPSGKVEIYSALMEKYGYDPMPKHVEQHGTIISDPTNAEDYPLTFFIGAKGDPYFQQQGRNIASLRRLAPEPWVEMHPDTAYDLGLSDGDYVAVETPARFALRGVQAQRRRPPEGRPGSLPLDASRGEAVRARLLGALPGRRQQPHQRRLVLRRPGAGHPVPARADVPGGRRRNGRRSTRSRSTPSARAGAGSRTPGAATPGCPA